MYMCIALGVVWWSGSLHVHVYSSRDGLVKLWDLDTQHCFQTLVSHDREVWSFAVVGGYAGDDGTEIARLVVASGDAQPKVYQLAREDTAESKVKLNESACEWLSALLLGSSCCCGEREIEVVLQ